MEAGGLWREKIIVQNLGLNKLPVGTDAEAAVAYAYMGCTTGESLGTIFLVVSAPPPQNSLPPFWPKNAEEGFLSLQSQGPLNWAKIHRPLYEKLWQFESYLCLYFSPYIYL